MKINKWLEASLFKEFMVDVVNIQRIYFFTDAPVATVDFPSTEGVAYWTDNLLASKVLLQIDLSPTESYNIGSENLNLDMTFQWASTASFSATQDGIANWFLMTDSSNNPYFMGQVTGPDLGGDIELSNNTIVTGQKYKIYNYKMSYNQLV